MGSLSQARLECKAAESQPFTLILYFSLPGYFILTNYPVEKADMSLICENLKQ